MAEAKGITLEELNVIGEKEDWTDKEVDAYQKQLGQTGDNLVISGWVSFHFIPNSVKIFLEVSDAEGSRRIHTDSGVARQTEAKQFGTLADVQKSVHARMENSSRRYQKYYGLDIYDPRHYNLIVDTTDIPAAEVVERIIAYLQTQQS